MNNLLATDDGSPTLRDVETGELYHNRAGAYSEALLNYVYPSGALARLQSHAKLYVLDVCFGLGYNSFVLIQEAIRQNAAGRIKIQAIERDASVLAVLAEVLANEKFNELRQQFDPSELQERRSLSIERNDLQIEFSLDINSVRSSLPEFSMAMDYVFHDPFSPRHMPELWTLDIFRRYYAILAEKRGAVLTYSSAGAVRGGLSEAGFVVGKTTALGGKSGGTIGMIDEFLPEMKYYQLTEDESKRMSGVSGIPYTDRGFLLDRQEVVRLRQLEQRSQRECKGACGINPSLPK